MSLTSRRPPVEPRSAPVAAMGLRSPEGVPGEPGLWLFVGGDMVVFAVLFAITLVVRADDPGTFARSSEALHQGLGAIDTLLLLSGSACVALAVRLARADRNATAQRLVAAAIGCGLGFLAMKAVEWTDLLSSGHSPSANDVFQLYFLLTGMHLLHVFIGLGALVAIRRQLRAPAGRISWRIVEGGACYWHMVDLLWLVLFPLLYLLR